MAADSYNIQIAGGGQFTCREDERVLIAMERSGAKGIGVGCRGGGCGFCRVRVVKGRYRTGRMSAAQISTDDRTKGYALACQLYPLHDLLIETV